MSDVVLFEELKTSNGYIGRATLNRPQKLNTLTTEMIALLHRQFAAWAEDDACKTVFLDGAGDKGFCAGGDVVAVTTDPSPEMAVGRTFFSTEYDLNYFMHTFPKPLLVWGGGICMGGGFGLLQGCSTRIVTDTSRLAMPECAIGFHPDVGGSWFLQRVSAPMGEVIAITGVHFSGADAVDLGLADVLVANDSKDAILAALTGDRLERSRPCQQGFRRSRCARRCCRHATDCHPQADAIQGSPGCMYGDPVFSGTLRQSAGPERQRRTLPQEGW